VTRSSLALGGILAAAVVAGCRDTKIVTNSYSSLAEARTAGAMSAGYIPEGLPPSAHDIRAAYDPNSPDRWVIFSFPDSERPQLMALLDPTELSLDGRTFDVPGRIEWWPALLRNRLNGERIKATGLVTYRSRGGDWLYAVNWSQGRAYVWTTHAP